MVVHLIKLSVGSRSVDDLRRWQTGYAASRPPLRHSTRNFPRRASEIVAGGSLYWVIAGLVSVRQRILRIEGGTREDGTPCTDLIFDPVLVPVRERPMRPFQGWRYLEPADAPADLEGVETGLPDALRRELAGLGLL